MPTPKPTPAPSPGPSTSPVPTALLKVEVTTFGELQDATITAGSDGAKLVITLLADIALNATIDINSHVTMHSSSGAVLSGTGLTRLFTIGSGGTLDAENVSFTQGYDPEMGGAFYVDRGSLSLMRCSLTHNSAGSLGEKDKNGGGVYNHYGTVKMRMCTMSNNFCAYKGGVAYNMGEGALMEWSDCVVIDNKAAAGGAAGYNDKGTHDMDNCKLSLNSASDWGGAVYNKGTMFIKNCTMANCSAAAKHGGAVRNNGGHIDWDSCSLTGNSANLLGGAVYNHNGGSMSFKNTTIANNYANDLGGGVCNDGGVINWHGVVLTNNVAANDGGGIWNSGTMNLERLTLKTNTAENGGGVHNNAGFMYWSDSELIANSARTHGGGYNNFAGLMEWADCKMEANVAAAGGAVGYNDASEEDSTTRFFRGRFLGEYDNATCVFESSDSGNRDSKLELYYQHEIMETGVICSAYPVLVYNAEVLLPFSTSHEDAITCSYDGISDYCDYDYDCRNAAEDANSGIRCTCTSDGVTYDPFTFNRGQGAGSGCANSQFLIVPQTAFTMVIDKSWEPTLSTTMVVLANFGDVPLYWNLTTEDTTEDDGAWSLTPNSGSLDGSELTTATVTLATWGLVARPAPYKLKLKLTSNSYINDSRIISVEAFVSAYPDPKNSFVTFQTPPNETVASGALSFDITTVDAAGLVSEDASNLAYFARVVHDGTHDQELCEVSYDAASTHKHQGTCQLPGLRTGTFSFQVWDNAGAAIGAEKVAVERCPKQYYLDGYSCEPCAEHVSCAAGSSLSDWLLDKGYWRVGDESTKLYKCRFGVASCPGTANSSCLDAQWPGCKCGYAGALCAVCAPHYYASLAGSRCENCSNRKGLFRAVAWRVSLFVVVLVGVVIVLTQRKRIANSAHYRTARYFYRLLRVKVRIIFFAVQTLSEFSIISANTDNGDGGFPEPAATFSRLLGVANLDVIAFIPIGCVWPDATFHSKLVAKTLGPIVLIALLWIRPAVHTITSADQVRQDQSARVSAKYSLLLLEIFLASISTTIIETFVCTEMDGEYFLNAELTLRCDGSPKRISWTIYAGFALALYTAGQSFMLSALTRDIKL